MGFAEFFSRIKGGASDTARELTIDVGENGITINGKKPDIPSHIDAFSEVLGAPRAVRFKTAAKDREIMEKMYGAGMVTDRVNYAWDSLGVYAYTHNGKVVNCFGIALKPSKRPHYPRRLFKGTLTINGRDWLSAALDGECGEFSRRLHIGGYLINVSYFDDDNDDFDGASANSADDFSDIEIQLK